MLGHFYWSLQQQRRCRSKVNRISCTKSRVHTSQGSERSVLLWMVHWEEFTHLCLRTGFVAWRFKGWWNRSQFWEQYFQKHTVFGERQTVVTASVFLSLYLSLHMTFCYPKQCIPLLLVFLADGRDFLKAFPLSLGSIWSVLAFGEIPPLSIVVAVVDFRLPSVTICWL